MRTRALLIAVVTLVLLPVATARADGPPWQWLWVYVSTNFQVNERADAFIALMQRAKKAGYNGMLVADYKFGNLKDRPDWYYANLERVRKAAAETGMELIPAVMPIGYSGSILQHDPDLAAGIPVRECPMIVKGGKATVADPANRLSNGGFEEAGGRKMPGWDWMDACARRDTGTRWRRRPARCSGRHWERRHPADPGSAPGSALAFRHSAE